MNVTLADLVTDYTGHIADQVRDVLSGLLVTLEGLNPRSSQQSVGPSELGHRCDRRLAYRVIGDLIPDVKPDDGADWSLWARVQGSAIHAALDNAATSVANTRGDDDCGVLHETTIMIDEGLQIRGTFDCFIRDPGIVVDWKYPSVGALMKARKYGPSHVYRVQSQLYGYGLSRQGFEVNYVCIVFLPRTSDIKDAVVYVEPYDPMVARSALTRFRGIKQLVTLTGVRENPALIKQVPFTGGDCRFCPHFTPITHPRDEDGLAWFECSGKQ